MQEHGARLHKHQVNAVNSLRQHWGRGESLLLADDSGLGKSTSFIAFVHSLRYALPLFILWDPWVLGLSQHHV